MKKIQSSIELAYFSSIEEIQADIQSIRKGLVCIPEENAARSGLEITLSQLENRLRDLERVVQPAIQGYQRDEKTGLWTMGFFADMAYQFLRQAARNGDSVTLTKADGMNVKGVNRFGDPAGDVYIRSIRDGIIETVRSTDMVGRNSSAADEFFILSPNTDQEGAQKLEEKLKETFRERYVQLPKKNQSVKVGVAIGVATYTPVGKKSLPFAELNLVYNRLLDHANGNMITDKENTYATDPSFRRNAKPKLYPMSQKIIK